MNHNSKPAVGQSRYSTAHRIVALFFLISDGVLFFNRGSGFPRPPRLSESDPPASPCSHGGRGGGQAAAILAPYTLCPMLYAYWILTPVS